VAAFPDALGSLSLVLTADCNLRCQYCYQDRKHAAAMPWPVLRSALDLARHSRQRTVHVSFLGGEPLLESRLIRRAVAYAARRSTRRPRLHLALVTNGLLLDNAFVRLLVREKIAVQLSFDGVAAAQNLRAAGTFKRLDRLLTNLRRAYPSYFRRHLSVAVTVPIPALPHLAASFEYLIEKDVREVSLAAAIGQIGWNKAAREELERQFARIYRVTLQHRRLTGRTPLTLFRRPPGRRANLPGWQTCGVASARSLVVDVDGRVYPCSVLAQSYQRPGQGAMAARLAALALGDIRDPELAVGVAALPALADAAGIFVRQDSKRSSYGPCAKCPVVGECVVCPVACTKDPAVKRPRQVSDYLCAFNRVALTYRRRFPPTARPSRPLFPEP
jgi:sulfatase maturation enzyme AslB (radical SAM superfamily)